MINTGKSLWLSSIESLYSVYLCTDRNLNLKRVALFLEPDMLEWPTAISKITTQYESEI